MKKSIEISGTTISLDEIISVSPIKKYFDFATEEHFEMCYRSYHANTQRVVIVGGKVDGYIYKDSTIVITTILDLILLRKSILVTLKC